MVGHFVRLVTSVSLIAIAPGSRRATEHRAPCSDHPFAWTPAVQKKCGGKGEGKGRRELSLPEGADPNWDKTWRRLVVELLFIRPGTSMNPGTAYANINNFIKEDIYRSVNGFFFTATGTIIQ